MLHRLYIGLGGGEVGGRCKSDVVAIEAFSNDPFQSLSSRPFVKLSTIVGAFGVHIGIHVRLSENL